MRVYVYLYLISNKYTYLIYLYINKHINKKKLRVISKISFDVS